MITAPAHRLKRSQASLVGGIACGVGVMILYLLLAGDVTTGHLAIGAAIGLALGSWIRLADL